MGGQELYRLGVAQELQVRSESRMDYTDYTEAVLRCNVFGILEGLR